MIQIQIQIQIQRKVIPDAHTKKVLSWAWNVVIRYPKQRKSLDDLKCQHTQHFCFGNTFCFTKDYSSTGSQRRVLTDDPMACCLFRVKINSGIGCYLTLLVFWDSSTCCLALLFMNIIQICSFFLPLAPDIQGQIYLKSHPSLSIYRMMTLFLLIQKHCL